MTPFSDGKDGELRELIMEMENFPNVRRVSGDGKVKKALLELGVYPRTAFTKENKKILTAFREDKDTDYIYLYHYMYTEKETFTVEIELPCTGRLYQMDCWSGRETELNCVSRSKRGMVDVLLTEDRGHGYMTEEIYYETEKPVIHVGKTTLLPWKEIRKAGSAVSGVGYYRTSFCVDQLLKGQTKAFLRIGGAYGNTAAVRLNGEMIPGFDFAGLTAEVTENLQEGINELEIQVTSTLENRLLERGYFDTYMKKKELLEDDSQKVAFFPKKV